LLVAKVWRGHHTGGKKTKPGFLPIAWRRVSLGRVNLFPVRGSGDAKEKKRWGCLRGGVKGGGPAGELP